LIRLSRLAPLPLVLAAALPAQAGDFNAIGTLTQPEFRGLAEDLAAATSYKGVTPATPLGMAGFDLGLELSGTDVKNTGAFNKAGAGSDSTLYVPKVHLHKGLFGGLDIGGFAGRLPVSSGTIVGAEVRWAAIDDTLTTPAVALRLSGTRTTGLGDVKADSVAADVMVSKRLTLVTPYAGVGTVRSGVKASGTALAEEKFTKTRGFLGVNVNLALVNLAVEAEKQGDNTTLSAKAGWRF